MLGANASVGGKTTTTTRTSTRGQDHPHDKTPPHYDHRNLSRIMRERTSDRTNARTDEREQSHSDEPDEGFGLGGLLRSLIKGIPFCEGAESQETLHLARPSRSSLTINNANGRTRVQGEERDDIEVIAFKRARAESTDAAQRMVEDIRIRASDSGEGLEIDVEIPSKWNRHGTANLDIRVPHDLAVSVTSANGKVCLRGMRAAVHAKSSNGAVSIEDVVGDIDPTHRLLAEHESAGEARAQGNGNAAGGKRVERGDRRRVDDGVAERRHQYRRPEPDVLGSFGGPGKRRPNVGIQSRGVVQPSALVSEFLGDLHVFRRGHRGGECCRQGDHQLAPLSGRRVGRWVSER